MSSSNLAQLLLRLLRLCVISVQSRRKCGPRSLSMVVDQGQHFLFQHRLSTRKRCPTMLKYLAEYNSRLLSLETDVGGSSVGQCADF